MTGMPTVRQLLREERELRAKQPPAWTKQKYRLGGLMMMERDKNKKIIESSKTKMTLDDIRELYSQNIRDVIVKNKLRKI